MPIGQTLRGSRCRQLFVYTFKTVTFLAFIEEKQMQMWVLFQGKYKQTVRKGIRNDL